MGWKRKMNRKKCLGENFFMGPYLRCPRFNKIAKKITVGENNTNVSHGM